MENPIIQELLSKTAGMATDAAVSAKSVNEALRKATAWEETHNPEAPAKYSFRAEAEDYANDIQASLHNPAGYESIRKQQDRKSKSVLDQWVRENNPKFGKSLKLGAGFDPANAESMTSLSDAFAGAFTRGNVGQAMINRIKAPVTSTGISTTTGLVPYALDDLAKVFVPFLYPLRQATPRIVVGGTQYNYKVISALNPSTGFSFVQEATASSSGRAPALTVTTSQQTALFKLFGVENFLTVVEKFGTRSKIDGADFNADMLQYFLCLQAEMIEGDWTMLGANGGTGAAVLGAPSAAPTAASTQFTGGSLTASTHYYIKVSALNLQGVKIGAQGNNGTNDATGESTPSAELNQQTAASGAGSQSIAITFNSVVGAVAYNVYIGTTSGGEKYYSTVYCTGGGTTATAANTVNITATATSTNVPNSADQTLDANAYGGLISIASGALTGQLNTPYVKDLLAAGFTGDNTTGVQEFDAAFHYWWDTYRLSPTVIWMNGYDAKAASKIILGSSAPVFRVDVGDGQQNIRGTIMANSQLNPYIGNGQGVEFRIHPYLPRGTVLFNCENLGPVYSMAGIPSPFYMLMGFDAMAFDFAFTGMKYENGVYEYGVPVAPFPGATGCIRNTGN